MGICADEQGGRPNDRTMTKQTEQKQVANKKKMCFRSLVFIFFLFLKLINI